MKNSRTPVIPLLPIFLCLLALVASRAALAQQIGPKIRNLDDVTLAFPRPWDREALVILDFTVKSDGTIADIGVVGGFSEPRFADAAIAAANQLQFDPATERGEAVDWPGFRMQARFVYRNLFHTMNIGPNDALKEAEALMADNKATDAERVLNAAIAGNTKLYFEDAIFHLRLGEVFLATNRPAQAVHALRRATQAYLPGEHQDFNVETAQTHNRIFVVNIQEFFTNDFISTRLVNPQVDTMPALTPTAPLQGGAQRGQAQRSAGVLRPKVTLGVLNNTLLESAWQRAYLANISTGNVAAVINAYDNLETVSDQAISEQMQAQIAQVRQLQSAGQRLTSAQVIMDGDTVHYPTHRILAAVNVNGTVDTLDFQCENRIIRLPFQEEVEWNMPASWGDCALRFRGEDGASFTLVEFPD